MSNFSNFFRGDEVIVSDDVTGGHEFSATFEIAYDDDSDKVGLAVVIDQDGDAFDVEPGDIRLAANADDEHDTFRNDVEADADALDSAGFGEGDNDQGIDD